MFLVTAMMLQLCPAVSDVSLYGTAAVVVNASVHGGPLLILAAYALVGDSNEPLVLRGRIAQFWRLFLVITLPIVHPPPFAHIELLS